MKNIEEKTEFKGFTKRELAEIRRSDDKLMQGYNLFLMAVAFGLSGILTYQYFTDPRLGNKNLARNGWHCNLNAMRCKYSGGQMIYSRGAEIYGLDYNLRAKLPADTARFENYCKEVKIK